MKALMSDVGGGTWLSATAGICQPLLRVALVACDPLKLSMPRKA